MDKSLQLRLALIKVKEKKLSEFDIGNDTFLSVLKLYKRLKKDAEQLRFVNVLYHDVYIDAVLTLRILEKERFKRFGYEA